MKQSISYYITLFVIKLKGLKKDFSQDPIDYKKIRKADVRQPKGRFFNSEAVKQFTIAKTTITEIKKQPAADKLLLFIHGGAFISGPAQHHWDSIKTIANKTDINIWLCDYPKAPEHTISEMSTNIDQVYKAALEQYAAAQIVVMGDSVGGTLATALTQRLVKENTALPNKLLLISPVMDASMTNPAIEKLDLVDPMLSKVGVLSAKKLCAENDNLKDPAISPLYGSFTHFPKTFLFLAENDITYADQLLAAEKLKAAQVDLSITSGKNMPHIWPLLPVMNEAKLALEEIVGVLNA